MIAIIEGTEKKRVSAKEFAQRVLMGTAIDTADSFEAEMPPTKMTAKEQEAVIDQMKKLLSRMNKVAGNHFTL